MDNKGAQNFLDGIHGNVVLDTERTLLVGESAGKQASISILSMHNEFP